MSNVSAPGASAPSLPPPPHESGGFDNGPLDTSTHPPTLDKDWRPTLEHPLDPPFCGFLTKNYPEIGGALHPAVRANVLGS